MKRKGWLIEQIADIENLRLAFWKAQRSKRCDKEVIDFASNLGENLLQLSRSISSSTVDVDDYRFFTIYEPKERLVCAASFKQKVLYHAIMNVCHNDFERMQIFDSYATRINKGTYKALVRANLFHRKYQYCLKLDVRKFFDSIDHDLLNLMLSRLYKDEKLLELFRRIIDSYHTSPGKGLPIGNLTSQYLANHYLSFLDHISKEKFKAAAYVRYMDDILIWDDDKFRLKTIGLCVKNYLKSSLYLHLKLMELKSTRLQTTFLGYRLSKYGMSLANKSVKRYKTLISRLYYEYDLGLLSQEDMNKRLVPIIAFTDKVDSKKVRRIMMDKL